MKNFSFKMWSKGLAICLTCVIALSGCRYKVQNYTEEADTDSVVHADTMHNDTAVYVGSGKGLNDIRFGDFDDNDWLDNEYIRCLRRYLDDYNSGKVQNEELNQYREMVKGKFIIGWAEPFMMGGLILQIIFVDYPDDIFTAWVYSGVDEEKELVLDYETRSIRHEEDKTGYTKDYIMQVIKEHPEYKLW